MSKTDAIDNSKLSNSAQSSFSGEQEALVREFQSRLQYLSMGYEVWSRSFGLGLDFNESLDRLKERLDRGVSKENLTKDLHLEIASAIGMQAKIIAEAGSEELADRHWLEAAEHVSSSLTKRQGRPVNPVLELHLAGLMALVEEFSGLRVFARRDRNSEYDPHFPKGISKIIPEVAKRWDSEITDTQLVNLVKKIRKQPSTMGNSFGSLFPGYGRSWTPCPDQDVVF